MILTKAKAGIRVLVSGGRETVVAPAALASVLRVALRDVLQHGAGECDGHLPQAGGYRPALRRWCMRGEMKHATRRGRRTGDGGERTEERGRRMPPLLDKARDVGGGAVVAVLCINVVVFPSSPSGKPCRCCGGWRGSKCCGVVGVAFGVLQAEPQPRRNLVAAHAARAAR